MTHPSPAQFREWAAQATPADRRIATAYTTLAWLATTGSVIVLLIAIDTVRYAIGLSYETVPRWAYWAGGIGVVLRFALMIPNRRLRRDLLPIARVSAGSSQRRRRNTLVKIGFLASYAIIGSSWLVFAAVAALTASLGVPAVYRVTVGLMGRRRLARR